MYASLIWICVATQWTLFCVKILALKLVKGADRA